MGNPIPSTEPWPDMWRIGGGIISKYEIFFGWHNAHFIYQILDTAMVHVPGGIIQLH